MMASETGELNSVTEEYQSGAQHQYFLGAYLAKDLMQVYNEKCRQQVLQ